MLLEVQLKGGLQPPATQDHFGLGPGPPSFQDGLICDLLIWQYESLLSSSPPCPGQL